MSLLLLNQTFGPDTTATGQLLSDVANHLKANGEHVTVICGSGSFGDSLPGESQPRGEADTIRLRDQGIAHKLAGRMGSYLAFLCGALWHGLRVRRPDTVITLTTPPLLSLVGLAIQKLRGSRHIIWEMDVYPDVAIELGVLRRDSISAKFFGWLADLPRKHADRIIVLGECMRERLLMHGIDGEKIRIAENWAEQEETAIHSFPQSLPGGALSVLYSGNLGMAHDAETVAMAFPDLDSRGLNVRYTFAGGGSRHAWLKSFCLDHGIGNVEFQPFCARHELPARLRSGHIGLVTQREEALGSSVPSKTYGIMAAGRPILFIGPRQATTARMIERFACGWQIDNGDSRGLADLLERLDRDRNFILEAGYRAQGAFVANYQRHLGVARIADIINGDIVREPRTAIAARAAAG